MTNEACIILTGGGVGARCYRLDPALIGRFYTGQMRLMDKRRIRSGKPPLPVSRAAGVAQ